jgi:hypothetical protein
VPLKVQWCFAARQFTAEQRRFTAGKLTGQFSAIKVSKIGQSTGEQCSGDLLLRKIAFRWFALQ